MLRLRLADRLVFSCMTLLLAGPVNETAVISCPISIPLDSGTIDTHDLGVDRSIVIQVPAMMETRWPVEL